MTERPQDDELRSLQTCDALRVGRYVIETARIVFPDKAGAR